MFLNKLNVDHILGIANYSLKLWDYWQRFCKGEYFCYFFNTK